MHAACQEQCGRCAGCLTWRTMSTETIDVRSDRLQALPPYLFVEIDRKKRARKAAGADVIDLGIGDPDRPTPGFIIEAMDRGTRNPENHRYPSGRGSPAFREACAAFMKERFGVDADPARHIACTIGSKEGIGHLPIGVCNTGDAVLCPDPGYPVYVGGAVLAGVEPVLMPLRAEAGWTPDVEAIPADVVRRSRLMWLNYPNNPTAATVDVGFYEKVFDWAEKTWDGGRGVIVAGDMAYSEMFFEERPVSIWEAKNADLDRTVAIEFHSLSKTFNMTGWRIGFVVGHERVVDALMGVKSNVDSGAFGAVQEAGIAALANVNGEEVAQMREVYRERRDAIIPALREIGCEVEPPTAGFFVWAKTPGGMGSMEFAGRVLEEADVVVVPGEGFSPGARQWFRIALTVEVDRLRVAAERMRRMQ